MPGPEFEIPRTLADGGAGLADDSYKSLLRAIRSLKNDFDNLKTIFDGHKHSFDGTQAADSISETPVTGATTGSATGGVATVVTVGTTLEPGFDDYLHINR
jgi:hypothetical protein